MNRTWKFTDLEFYAQWFAEIGEALPWPFFFTTDVPTEEQFEALRFEALERLRRTLHGSFDDAMAAIVNPDVLIAVNGWDGCEPRKPETLLRVLAVRRATRGYVVAQLPGKTYWHAGGFTVVECDAVALGDAVVALLPETEPGKQADIVLATADRDDERDYSFGKSAVHDSFDDSVAERAERFLEAPTPSIGTIDIVQGRSLFGPRGVTRHRLEWRDLAEDGRYVIDDQNPPLAVAADKKRLTTMVNTRIAAIVRAIKDERV
ncbi:ESX secretion-associated protein EspG [Nocardia sp. NBC_00565]|uniref:ESX secretion-associated protein EspG n=1 Tax=Nocardia sp. NBC_00565 TaxID=2975993 RepID=UPI002E8202F2|nr:ESX secretion-associated protein EspG [Nocardia sp. NBC_00565]WUC02871.1 ESX secretion-associated protein EspG [Nocardia sp. NBC_00565]